jgi:hypothetical protein
MKEMDASRRNDYWVPESMPEARSFSFGAPLGRCQTGCCWLWLQSKTGLPGWHVVWMRSGWFDLYLLAR